MENNKVFPVNNWHILVTEENCEILKKWRNDNFGVDTSISKMTYVTHDGRIGDDVEYSFKKDRKQITFDQFKKYVLKQEESIVPEVTEDLSYMIDLFKQLKLN